MLGLGLGGVQCEGFSHSPFSGSKAWNHDWSLPNPDALCRACSRNYPIRYHVVYYYAHPSIDLICFVFFAVNVVVLVVVLVFVSVAFIIQSVIASMYLESLRHSCVSNNPFNCASLCEVNK